MIVGTFFMAFHSAQGPQLGIPQLIQSRAQFGYFGALIVVPGVLIMYVGYNIFNLQAFGVATSAIMSDTGTEQSNTLLYLLGSLLVAVVAVYGYQWIHVIQRNLTYLFLVVFGVLTLALAATVSLPSGAMDPGAGFTWKSFLIQFSVAAASQLGWAPYVADYSRYLPSSVGVRATFWWTYLGSSVSAAWMMLLGALLVAAMPDSASPLDALKAASDNIATGLGVVVLAVSLPALLAVTAVNTYCGGLTLLTVVDTITNTPPTALLRIAAVVLVAIVSCVGAITSGPDFLANFYNIILIMLYSFIPWTAINLLDYYFVRRGHYDVDAIFEMTGVYGRWNARGLTGYAVAFFAMIPFWNLSWYQGPVAEALGGADLSMFVGLPIAGAIYIFLSRNVIKASASAHQHASALDE